LIRFAEKSSLSTGPASPSMKTLQSSKEPTLEQLTLFAEASPARISASRAKVRGLRENAAAYGQNTPELLARFAPDTSSWKTSQHCLVEGLETFSETWPRSGLMRNGTAYQLPPLALRIGGIESGSWPTPDASVAQDGEKAHTWLARRERVKLTANNGNGMGMPLTIAVQLWPTPTAVDGRRGNKPPRPWDTGIPLAQMVAMYPTPTARDFRSPGRSRLERTGSKSGDCLPQAIGGQLNPTWVEWLMGVPAEWTALDNSEMRSSRKSLKSSGEQS
jgi:DNA (cytosine-5)-methyltransferase 1